MKITKKELLDAGCHFGHLTRKWDPRMAPYIFTEKNGIHLLDLNKTLDNLDKACTVIRSMASHNKKIMFVATKKQAKDIVADRAKRLNMPYVTERWLGGMLTNFVTIKKSLKKMSGIDKLMKDVSFENLAKRERLMKQREKEKLERILGGIADMSRIPHALFVVDIKREHIAVKEAQKLNIPIFAIVDTNSDPNQVDYLIPANDDAFKSIGLIVNAIADAIEEGLQDRKRQKEEEREKAVKVEEEKEQFLAETEEKKEDAVKEVKKDAKTDDTDAKTEKAAEVKKEVKATPKKEAVAKEKATEAKAEKAEKKEDAPKDEKAVEAPAKDEEKPEKKPRKRIAKAKPTKDDTDKKSTTKEK